MIIYNINDIKQKNCFKKMYIDYITELSQYSERLRNDPITDDDIQDINTNPFLIRYFITNEKETPIGFCLMGFGENTHPGTDWFIAEFYIQPKYRRKGYGKKFMRDFIKTHPGEYCYFVLKENQKAKAFWNKVRAENGCIDTKLCYNAEQYTPEDADFYAFKYVKQ